MPWTCRTLKILTVIFHGTFLTTILPTVIFQQKRNKSFTIKSSNHVGMFLWKLKAFESLNHVDMFSCFFLKVGSSSLLLLLCFLLFEKISEKLSEKLISQWKLKAFERGQARASDSLRVSQKCRAFILSDFSWRSSFLTPPSAGEQLTEKLTEMQCIYSLRLFLTLH